MGLESILSSESIYTGSIVNLRRDRVRLDRSDGVSVQTSREVVEHNSAVVMIPIDHQGSILLVKQFRYATGEFLLEAPAGGIEVGETPEEAATRELQEEIGYTAGKLRLLGGFWVAPGWCTEFIHAYSAHDLRPVVAHSDHDEDIEVIATTKDEVPNLIRMGLLKDAKTIAALMIALYLP